MGTGWLLLIVVGSVILYSMIGVFIGALSVNWKMLTDDEIVLCILFWPIVIWFMLGALLYRKTRALAKKEKDKIPEGCNGGFIDC